MNSVACSVSMGRAREAKEKKKKHERTQVMSRRYKLLERSAKGLLSHFKNVSSPRL